MEMVKHKNVRIAQIFSEEFAKSAKEHNNANAISIGNDVGTTDEIKNILDIFLASKFTKEKRHIRRINMLEEQ
jgi:ribose 5-phosphate isomerase B